MDTDRTNTAKHTVGSIEQMLDDRIFELNQFVYHVSHDLMAPLCRIQGLLNLIISERPVGHNENLDRIRQCIDQLSNFTQNTLAYSENLNVSPREEHIPIKNLVNEVYKKYKASYQDTDMTLKFQSDCHYIVSDPRRWNNILEILFSNAFQFKDTRKEDHVIKVQLRQRSGYLQLRFQDNGVGISDALLTQVKEIFVRGENSKGNGLGLYVLNQISENLGGDLSIQSHPGAGTRIQLKVPAKQPISRHKGHKTRNYTGVTASTF